jgi:hypothetical protein
MTSRNRGGLFSVLDRRRVARLLGAPLPAAARDVRFLLWQPSSDLAYSELVVRFDASLEAYREFVRACGLAYYEATKATVHLPIPWRTPGELAPPDWWQPLDGTPPHAAAGRVGLHGSVAMKWEDGRVYVFLVDTGHRGAGSTPP